MAYNSDKFDLNNWKITLPVDGKGKITGVATEIQNLLKYESRYFYDAPDGAMVFRASVNGASTSGSKYARSELREMDGGDRAAWKLSQGGTLTATVKIDKIPAMKDSDESPRLIVGQIHGEDEELVRLYWQNNTLYFMNDQAGSSNKEVKFQLLDSSGHTPSVGVGEKFSYKIDAYKDRLEVSVVADGKTYTSVTKINSVWQSDEFYFKAGLYLNTDENTATGEGQVSFYGLDFGHERGSGLAGLNPGLSPTPPHSSPDPEPEPQPVPGTGIAGTSGNDNIMGTHDVNIIHAGTGNDYVQGRDGNDVLYGDGGNDTLYGHWDNDLLVGGTGNDTLYGGQGKDSLKGGGGSDILRGEEGDDRLTGGEGRDHYYGGAGRDVFVMDKLDVADILHDFNPKEDRLDLETLLGSSGKASIATVSGQTGLYVDVDGSGSAKAVLVALFDDNSTVPGKISDVLV